MALSDWMTPSERRLSILLFGLAALGAGVRTGQRLSPEVTFWLESGGGIADPDTVQVGNTAPSRDGLPSASPGTPPAGDPPGPESEAGIDPNTAGVAVLIRLPGVGPALAARILADREAQGPYRRPEDLLRVRGIGPATLERIRDFLRFPTPPTPGTGP